MGLENTEAFPAKLNEVKIDSEYYRIPYTKDYMTYFTSIKGKTECLLLDDVVVENVSSWNAYYNSNGTTANNNNCKCISTFIDIQKFYGRTIQIKINEGLESEGYVKYADTRIVFYDRYKNVINFIWFNPSNYPSDTLAITLKNENYVYIRFSIEVSTYHPEYDNIKNGTADEQYDGAEIEKITVLDKQKGYKFFYSSFNDGTKEFLRINSVSDYTNNLITSDYKTYYQSSNNRFFIMGINLKPNTYYTISKTVGYPSTLWVGTYYSSPTNGYGSEITSSSSKKFSFYSGSYTRVTLQFENGDLFYNNDKYLEYVFLQEDGVVEFHEDIRRDDKLIELPHPFRGLPSGTSDEITPLGDRILFITRVGEKDFVQQYHYTDYEGKGNVSIINGDLNDECHFRIDQITMVDDETKTDDDYKELGNLYTNNSGSPILDASGNKQYEFKFKRVNKGNAEEKSLTIPYKLQKSNNVSDRVYWSNDDGCYVLEKNVEEQFPAVTSKAIVGNIKLGDDW